MNATRRLFLSVPIMLLTGVLASFWLGDHDPGDRGPDGVQTPFALMNPGATASTGMISPSVTQGGGESHVHPASPIDHQPALWSLQMDEEPRSHRHTLAKASSLQPLRSARVRISPQWLEAARIGGDFSVDLGAGLSVQGTILEIRTNIPHTAGVRTYAGILTEPPGMFSLEHHETRGWGGSFLLTDADQMVRLMPQRDEVGSTRLEVWPRRATLCSGAGADDDGNFRTAPPADPGIEVSQLESRPGADHVIYIDTNGETVSGTQWNHFYNAFNDLVVAPSGLDRDEVIAVWQRVAEDWAPFNVNVTTRRSVYNDAGSESRCMVVCTPTKSWMDDAKGGIATVDSFNNIFVSATCWCWNVQDWVACAETVSHEAAHCMGNSHASWESSGGLYEDEYYDGHDTDYGVFWAPIMGNSFNDISADSLTQFTIDDSYPGSTVSEDQLDEIAYELDLLFDDQLGSPGFPLVLVNNRVTRKGLLEQSSDVDGFLVTITVAGSRAEVFPNECGPNVDCWMEVLTWPDPTLVKRHDNERGSASSLGTEHVFQEPGNYWIRVGSDSCNLLYGYPRYGGVGTFTLRIGPPIGFETAAPVLAGAQDKDLAVGKREAIVEVAVHDASGLQASTLGNSVGVVLRRTAGGVMVNGVPVGPAVFGKAGDLSRVTRKYRFPAPGGWWDSAEGGAYEVQLAASAVEDEWGNRNTSPLVRALGNMTPDTTPPEVTAVMSATLLTEPTAPAVMRVSIRDQSVISMIGNGSASFQAIPANGNPTLTFAGGRVKKYDDGRRWEMTCVIEPPGGQWSALDAGQYTCVLRSVHLSDAAGHTTPSATVAAFRVTSPIHRLDFAAAGTSGFTLQSGWVVDAAAGTGADFDDPSPAQGNTTRLLGYALAAGATQYANDLDERAATSGPLETTGYEKLTLRYRRWLTLRSGDSARIEVNDATTGDSWTTVWTSGDSHINDRSWVTHEVALPAFVSNGTLQMRFIMGRTNAENSAGGWNIDDLEIVAGDTWRASSLVLAAVPQLGAALETDGGAARFTVRLNQQPAATVTVNLNSDSQSTLDDTSHLFTPANWFTPQTVIVIAVNDLVAEGPHSTTIKLACLSPGTEFHGVRAERSVPIIDNDASLLTVQPADAAILPGKSSTLSVSVIRGAVVTFQWYEGPRGDRRRPITRDGDGRELAVSLPSNAVAPRYFWVEVSEVGRPGRDELSQLATVAPLVGLDGFKARLLDLGYTPAQLSHVDFLKQDPDGNGLNHFAEFATGLLPGDTPAGVRSVEAVPSISQPGSFDLLITLPPLQIGVGYTVQSSIDSAGWEAVAELTGNPLDDPAPGVRVPARGTDKLWARVTMIWSGP